MSGNAEGIDDLNADGSNKKTNMESANAEDYMIEMACKVFEFNQIRGSLSSESGASSTTSTTSEADSTTT